MKTVFKIKVFSDKSWENFSPWDFHKRNPKGKSSGKRKVILDGNKEMHEGMKSARKGKYVVKYK